MENSIKYAVARSESGGTIRLEASVRGEELLLLLSDDGPGIAFEKSHLPRFPGVGIKQYPRAFKGTVWRLPNMPFRSGRAARLKITIRLPYEVQTRKKPQTGGRPAA